MSELELSKQPGHTNRRKSLLLVSMFFVFLLLPIGCHLPSRPISDSNYRPVSEQKMLKIQSALDRDLRGISSFRALARVKLKKGIISESFKQVIVFKRPDKLRIDFLEASTNSLIAIVAVNSGVIKAINIQEQVAHIGVANEKNIGKLLSIPLSPEAVMLFFCGRFQPPADKMLSSTKLFENPEDKGKVLFQSKYKNGKKVNFFIHSSDWDIPNNELRSSAIEIVDSSKNSSEMMAKFLVLSPATVSTLIPTKFKVSIPPEDVTISLNYDSFVLNPDISGEAEEVFDIDIPEGLPIYDLDL